MAAGFTLTDNTQAGQASQGSATFSSVTFNTGPTDIPIVMFSFDTPGTIVPTVTINGVSATVYSTGLILSEYAVGFAYLSATSLTTAAVVLTYNGVSPAGVTIQGGKVTGASAVFNQNNPGAYVSVPAAATVNVPAGGVGIVSASIFFHSGTSVTFSGSTNDPSGDGQISSTPGHSTQFATAHTLTSGTPSTITVSNASSYQLVWAMISFSAAPTGISIWPYSN